MIDVEKQDKLVLKAYQLYKSNTKPDVEELANVTLKKLRDEIDEWDGTIDNMKFYSGYLVSREMAAISSTGMAQAAVNTNDFLAVMAQPAQQALFQELLLVRKNNKIISERLAGPIADVRFIYRTLNLNAFASGQPKQYVNRFVVSVFTECMTTIAKEKQLKDTAILLGKNPNGVSNERLQIQVRTLVDESLERLQLDENWNLFNRAVIGYYLLDAAKELELR